MPLFRFSSKRALSIFMAAPFGLGGFVEEGNDRLGAERHAAVRVAVEIVYLGGLEHVGRMRGL